MIGSTVGSYRILDKLGEGGMGAVYLAEHTLIGRRAAVKVLLPELSNNQEIVNRFFNEARSTAQIKHPGLIDIYDFGYHTTGSAFIVMEYLEGESLASRLRREPQPELSLLATIGRQIASALAAAHQKGIVHRDLKPDNIFLVTDVEVQHGIRAKVLDFGIAKLQGEKEKSLKTRTGTVMGTPMYMSPEQCRGAGTVDARADVYSLGCILFEMATGRTPFIGEGLGEIIAAQIYQPPPTPSSIDPNVSPELERIIQRALAKKPDDRQPSMVALKAELDAIVEVTGRHKIVQVTQQGLGPSGTLLHTPLPKTPSQLPIEVKKQPTTLNHAASEVVDVDMGPPKKRGGLLVAVAAGVVIAGAGVAFISMRGKTPTPQPAPDPAPIVKPTPAAPPPIIKSDPEPPPPPTRITLKIVSEPAGAEVYRAADGVRVGKTPLEQKVAPTPGDAVFRIKMAGFRDEEVSLPADKNGEQSVKLVKVAHSGGHHASAAPPPPPPPGGHEQTKKPGGRVRDGVLDPFAQ